ncbi:helix-turn-helix transcriptional regulator [Nocardia wallacei]|uniref:helix-turn-helix transcriptional regulator n=1 Tax=Nocardia wallacei TaxID=480035 RepID=UPI002455F062|nr:helix-turn-helix transcriptional regulator [Nocardia wallacei]
MTRTSAPRRETTVLQWLLARELADAAAPVPFPVLVDAAVRSRGARIQAITNAAAALEDRGLVHRIRLHPSNHEAGAVRRVEEAWLVTVAGTRWVHATESEIPHWRWRRTPAQRAIYRVGARLRALRLATGHGPRAFADQLGWSPCKVSKTEAGHRLATPVEIAAWCTHADASIDACAELITLSHTAIQLRRAGHHA